MLVSLTNSISGNLKELEELLTILFDLVQAYNSITLRVRNFWELCWLFYVNYFTD